MKVIGVTGGTGSGKTTLLRFLQGRGAAVLDCDRVYDELLARDEALQSDLRREFGEAFSPDGTLGRAALAETVFSDPARLRRLNAIVYYHMGLEVRRLLVEAKNRGTEMAVIDAINLVDSCRARGRKNAPAPHHAARRHRRSACAKAHRGAEDGGILPKALQNRAGKQRDGRGIPRRRRSRAGRIHLMGDMRNG